ncbi:MAG: helix-turn-helix domain-containing protein [Bacteroidales bacterium]
MIKIILLMNPVYVTLFWAVVLSFYRSRKHAPKIFLGRFMFVAFVLYISHYFYFTGQFKFYQYIDSIYTLASLSVFPLYHIYVRMLTVDRGFSPSVHLKYLALPAIVFLLHLTGYLMMDDSEAMYYLKNVLPGRETGQGITLYMGMVYTLFRVVFIFQVIIYLFLNYRLISVNNDHLQEFYSNIEERKLNWVQFFNFSLAVTSLASIFAAILGRDMFNASDLHLAVPSVVFSVMLFLIGLLGNTQREVYTEQLQHSEIKEKPVSSPGIKKKMEILFEKEMIFKSTDLKIWDLCNMLGTNRTYVSRMINNEYGRNFCNHVNHYRVDYAKKLIGENKQITNEEIAELSGFGSVNSLYRAFKSFENKSLGEFRTDN